MTGYMGSPALEVFKSRLNVFWRERKKERYAFSFDNELLGSLWQPTDECQRSKLCRRSK